MNTIQHSEVRTDWFPSLILATFTCVTAVTTFYLSVFFKENLGFSGSQIGILFSVQAVMGMLAAFPTGIGNDRITSRTLVIISLMIQAVAFMLMANVRSFVPYVAIFFMWSLFAWVFRQSMDLQFLKIRNKKEMGNRLGFYLGWRFAGGAVGTVTAGYFIAAFDFKITLITVGTICFFLAIPSLFLAPTPISKVRLADYKADFSNRKVILFAVWMLLFTTHWGAEQTCYGLFLRKNLHLNINSMGWYIGAEFTTMIITMMIVGNLIGKKENSTKIAIFGLAASGIGHMGMVVEIVAVSVSFRILHGIGDGCMMLILYYGIASLFSVEHLGGNSGLINLSTMTGYVMGALIFGPVGEAMGYGYPLWISGLTTVSLIFPLLFVRMRHLATQQSG